MDVRPASSADLSSIAALHQETFQCLFSGGLSVSCLAAFYESLLSSTNGCLYVLWEGGQFAGFISGSTTGSYVSFSLKCRMLGEMFQSFRVLDILRAAYKAFALKRLGIPAELISLAVRPPLRRKGGGHLLLKAYEDFLRDHDVRRYFVFTDLNQSRGLEFYKATQFTIIKQLHFLGLEGVCLQKVLL